MKTKKIEFRNTKSGNHLTMKIKKKKPVNNRKKQNYE